ncbi:MAG: tetratricopeptide repeat protein [Flavobacteriales bacterium]|nr:tetratricopeptide repeat protein [Flavobacteriales bacterium]
MKNTILILLTFVAFNAFAQAPEDIFVEANSLYKAQNYKEAVDKYQEIVNTGYQSADLYYNIANCYYKIDELAPAVLFYKRAIKLNPNMDDAIFNLKMVHQKTVDKFEKVPKSFFAKFWSWLANIMSIHSWSITSVVLAFIGSTTFLIYFFSSTSALKRLSFVVSITSVVIMFIAIVIAQQQQTWQSKNKDAVIMSENSYVKVAPNESSGDSFILHEGTEVLVVDQVDDWMRIKLVDGKIGWIHSSDISLV